MDDDGDYAIDDFSEVYGYDDDEFYIGEDDEGHDSRYQELVLEEEEFADDQMADYEEIGEEEEGGGGGGGGGEDEEEYPGYDNQLDEDEEIAEDQDGVQLENELVDFDAEDEEEEVFVEEDEVYYSDGVRYWFSNTLDHNSFVDEQWDEEDYEGDPLDVPGLDSVEPCPPTRPRHIYFDSESSDSEGGGGGIDVSDSGLSGEWLWDEKVGSRGTKSSGSNASSWKGFQGPICPICFRRWKEEGRHCVCCLPCGHIYGMSCIQTWLQRPDSQKCPQCKEACNATDIKRLYGMQLATPKVEELQEKVERLEAKCADLETKDADWVRKEAEWQKREADLQQQLNKHKQAAGLVKDARTRGGSSGRRDPDEDSEPTKARKDRRL